MKNQKPLNDWEHDPSTPNWWKHEMKMRDLQHAANLRSWIYCAIILIIAVALILLILPTLELSFCIQHHVQDSLDNQAATGAPLYDSPACNTWPSGIPAANLSSWLE